MEKSLYEKIKRDTDSSRYIHNKIVNLIEDVRKKERNSLIPEFIPGQFYYPGIREKIVKTGKILEELNEWGNALDYLLPEIKGNAGYAQPREN